jgi:glycosyltransferase involved in cell wall biosynthesis
MSAHPEALKAVARPRAQWPRLCIVGPLPPPAGGMANQCEQLARLAAAAGATVRVVRNNADYRPAWIGRVPVVRAGFRLLPYLWRLWLEAGRCDVMHILANSGWAWHLFAAPAVWIARLRGVPAIVNYRGGHAAAFLDAAPRHVLATLRGADMIVTPSTFLQRVFARHGLAARIVPNIVDLSRFRPGEPRHFADAPHLVVTRHLEPIYDIATAIRAFAAIRRVFGQASLTIAGTGPELGRLQSLVEQLGLSDSVRFAGRIDNRDIPALYAQADLLLNPSTVDNMPISLLEAMASGVPIVTTEAGGIPDMVRDGEDALVVPVGDDARMAERAVAVLADRALAGRLRSAGLRASMSYDWEAVRGQWFDLYRGLGRSGR